MEAIPPEESEIDPPVADADLPKAKKGFEVTAEDPLPLHLYVPEIQVDEGRLKVRERVLLRLLGKVSNEHPGHVLYEAQTSDDDEAPAGFFMRVGSWIDRDNVIPDIVKGESGKKMLKILGTIAAAAAIEETARRSRRSRKKRD